MALIGFSRWCLPGETTTVGDSQISMTREELLQLIALVQRQQTELDNLEVKAARGGTPRRLFEALAAFANRTGYGAWAAENTVIGKLLTDISPSE